jgi:hypothetical protein
MYTVPAQQDRKDRRSDFVSKRAVPVDFDVS